MLLSIFRNYCFWAYGGTVDTLVLGALEDSFTIHSDTHRPH